MSKLLCKRNTIFNEQTQRLPDEESAVGTGVTQVAPVIEAIIEASKITNHGSVLFLEEPETNLHPSAQQKLADILYDLSQFVDVYIETHSEYIINRMRLRELEDKVKDGDTENLNILFTELNDGVTKISNVKIDEFGAIINCQKVFLIKLWKMLKNY